MNFPVKIVSYWTGDQLNQDGGYRNRQNPEPPGEWNSIDEAVVVINKRLWPTDWGLREPDGTFHKMMPDGNLVKMHGPTGVHHAAS